MTEKPTHPVVKAAIAMRCRRETMKRGRSCLILMRSFSTMGTPTLKSTDGAVSHWKYTIGNVIAYRDMYRADLRGRGVDCALFPGCPLSAHNASRCLSSVALIVRSAARSH
jgi:hypothetical protein